MECNPVKIENCIEEDIEINQTSDQTQILVNLDWLPAVFGLISVNSTCVCGYVTSEEDLETVLISHETFTQSRFHRDGDDQRKRMSRARRFFYGSRLLELSTHLTSNDRSRVYLCKYGMRYRYPKEKQGEVDESKKSFKTTSKIVCPARIYVNEVSVYTDYEVSGLKTKDRQDRLQCLKRDIIEKPHTLNVDRYYHIRLPLKPAHKGHGFKLPPWCSRERHDYKVSIHHANAGQISVLPPYINSEEVATVPNSPSPEELISVSTSENTDQAVTVHHAKTGRTHPSILKKIQELTASGITSARVQKIILKKYAEDIILNGCMEDVGNSTYYFPTESTIFNKIKSILYKTRGAERHQGKQKDPAPPLPKKKDNGVIKIYIRTTNAPVTEYERQGCSSHIC